MLVKGAWEKEEKDIQGKVTKTKHGIEINEIGLRKNVVKNFNRFWRFRVPRGDRRRRSEQQNAKRDLCEIE